MFCFQWHLTDRCNMACRHCYQEKADSAKPEPDLFDWQSLAIKLLVSMGAEPVGIDLTGGEPLIIPDLLLLIECLHHFKNVQRLGVISNGIIADRELLGNLAAFPRLSEIKLSLESGVDEVHDAVRGTGSFARLRSNIPVFVDFFPGKVTLMVTLSRINLTTIEETVSFARNLGVAGVMFERFVPMGNGAQLAASVLSAADWRSAVRTIVTAAGLAPIDPISLATCRAFRIFFDRPPPDNLEVALCNLGRDNMALMPDGTVFPCRRLALPLGNLHRQPFAMLREQLSAWEPARLRPELHGELCRRCTEPECAGCRALAQSLCGDARADDPQCLFNLL